MSDPSDKSFVSKAQFCVNLVSNPALIKSLVDACDSYMAAQDDKHQDSATIKICSILTFLLHFDFSEHTCESEEERSRFVAVGKYIKGTTAYEAAKTCWTELSTTSNALATVRALYLHLFTLSTLDILSK